MAAPSSVSGNNSPTRPVTPILSENYDDNNPLSTQTSGNAITAKNSSRANYTKANTSIQNKNSYAAAILASRKHLPKSQNGSMPLRPEQHLDNIPLFNPDSTQGSVNDRQVKNAKASSNPSTQGYNRSANFHLLVAGFNYNLQRQSRAFGQQEKKQVQTLENNNSENNTKVNPDISY